MPRGDAQPGPSERIADRLFLRLLDFAQTNIGPQWCSTGNRDSFWRVYVNNRDGAAVRVADRWYELTAEAVHLVPAWVRFDCRCRRPVTSLHLHLDVVGLPGSITRQLFDRPAALPRDASLDGVASRLIEMKREQNASPIAAVCAAKALAFAALARCIESLEPATQGRLARFARSGSAIAPALRRIDSRFNQPLAVPELAELCCLSPDHFIRRFREAVGQTPGQYLAERRVAAAAELLLLTDQSIERIAARCGFSNRFYFSRVFAKHIGTPPATYRKSQRV